MSECISRRIVRQRADYTKQQIVNYTATMGDEKKKKHVGGSVIFWLAFALALLVAFLICRNRIIGVLQRTEFFSKVFGTEPAFVLNHKSNDEEPVAELSSPAAEEPYSVQEPEITLIPQNNKFVYVEQTEDISEKTADASSAANETPSASPEKAADAPAPEKPAEKAADEAASAIKIVPSAVQSVEDESAPKMTQHLYFVMISGDGSVLRKEIERTIPKTITPLTAAINALLAGPNIEELEKGYMTLIPEDTQLLGAAVKDGVANINFSSEFRFNKYGVEGYYGQLAQIVYTATAFSNINSVQFLIEGEKIDYLSEGVFIGAPLTRTSLF